MSTRLPTWVALGAVVCAGASLASAADVASSYKIEARIIRQGEVVGAPVVSAAAHEPASVTLPASQNRTLVFWALVKPVRKEPDCYKVMVKVTLKGGAGRAPYVWDTDLARMCGDETKVLEHGDFHTTIRVQPEKPAGQ